MIVATSSLPASAGLKCLADKVRILTLRQTLLRTVRSFFVSRGFLEVETPIRIPTPALEDYIDAEPSGNWFLRTSPELHMKRLLAAGYERIFQIGPCFRQAERGKQHHPEFCMLEWYRLQADYEDVLADTIDLLRLAVREITGNTHCQFKGQTINLGGEWEQLTVQEAFEQYAGVDLRQTIEAGRFEQVLVERVEPHLGRGRPTILRDYPLACGGFAQPLCNQPNLLARWEIYIEGLELGNACSELTDRKQQQQRFAATAELRRREGRPVYPLDEPFLDVLGSGMPPAAGVALGVDRLIMVLADVDTIADVMPFSD